MRRRRVFRLLTLLLPLAPAAAVAVCWAVYWHRPAAILLRSLVEAPQGEVYSNLWLGQAGLHFERGVGGPRLPGEHLLTGIHFEAFRFNPFTGERRSGWSLPHVNVRSDSVYLHLPYWLLQLLTLAPPIALFWRRRRPSRRDAAGVCPACGYDLRATPDRCPECGCVALTIPSPGTPGEG
jgi:hypothetical protein